MSLLDAAAGMFGLAKPEPPKTIPGDIKTRCERGRKQMMQDATKRRLCQRFRMGDSYYYLTGDLKLNVTGTAVGPGPNGGKPGWRIRNRYDFLGPIIDEKVSLATSRIPGFEVTPTSPDSERKGASKLSENVLRYGYGQWYMRKAAYKAVDLAIGGGGCSYTMPYFDENVGPYVPVPDGMGGVKMQGQGEVKLLVLNGNQVYSEPGVDFNESPWYAIERARNIDEVQQIPGFTGIKLTANASTSDIPSDRKVSDNQVMVTEYFERPCPKYPLGRCLTFADSKPIVDYRLIDPNATGIWGPYPLLDADDQPLDEPILHELVHRLDFENGSDLGLTWALIDFERTAQDCYNKILEWKNRALLPQVTAAVNTWLTPRTDEYGAVNYYKPLQGVDRPQFEDVPQGWLQPLMEILSRTVQDMRDVAFADDFQADPNVAARTIAAVGQQNASKNQAFYDDLADWWSRVGRHCLLLVSRHYTEPRLLKIRGRWGQPQILTDFQGSKLLGEVDVHVASDSLKPRSRKQVLDELAWIQGNFPGYLSPEVSIAALHSGTAEDLIRSYDLDMGRVNDVIRAIVDGNVLDMPNIIQYQPPPPDPATGIPDPQAPPVPTPVPSFMPTDHDSIPIWKRMFGDWMKTQEFITLKPALQTVANDIWQSLLQKEMAHAVRQQQMQQQLAEGLGMANAAAPQSKGVPSTPGGMAAQPGPSAPPQLPGS